MFSSVLLMLQTSVLNFSIDGAAHANDASGEQSSFQWLSAGVGKLKKLTNIKGAVRIYPDLNIDRFFFVKLDALVLDFL